MSIAVCLGANTRRAVHAGGHFWVYLNWALGLRALGCKVIWLENIDLMEPEDQVQQEVKAVKSLLEHYGFADCLTVWSWTGDPLPASVTDGCRSLEEAVKADLLLNLDYEMRSTLVRCFRRSALLDIDPGLLQIWMRMKQMEVAPHDVYFTTGENVGQSGSAIPDAGVEWQYTPPCIAVDDWPPCQAIPSAAFTTVSTWRAPHDWVLTSTESYRNDKWTGFLPFRELPRHTRVPLELAFSAGPDHEEIADLEELGWRVREARQVTSTPWDYQRYVQSSLGEFSCAKPSCVRLQNAWVSDRTLAYLASGKPAVVQHTGPSRFLPDSAGLFRFRDVNEAVRSLETAAADYERHSKLARALAVEFFDAKKVVKALLERALA